MPVLVTGFLLLLLALAIIVVVGHIIAWMLYVPMAARVFGETPWLPAQWREPLEEGQSIEFPTDDGLRLRGTYLHSVAKQRKGVIAFCHELNGDRWSCVPYVEDLRRRGYDIFTFDFRNHGKSDHSRGYDPLPWVTAFDLADVRAVIDYLSSRSDAFSGGIGLLGVSKGGTVALCATAYDPRVKTLIVDGACPTERMQIHYARRFVKIYARFSWLIDRLPDLSLRTTNAWARFVIGRRKNCRFINVDTAARKIRQPVLMIHGRRDSHIPLEVVQNLRNTMSKRTKLWAISDAKHNGSISTAGETYHKRIARFFDHNLSTRPQAPDPAWALTRRQRFLSRFRAGVGKRGGSASYPREPVAAAASSSKN